MKWIVLILLVIGMFSLISAQEAICIDFDAPEKITNITLIENGGEIFLNWETPQDSPECSRIDYYEIYRDNERVYMDSENNFSETLSVGEYIYRILAIDLAHHIGEETILNVLIESDEVDSNPSTTSGGGGGGSSVMWECSDWTECINNSQSRECTDKYNTNLKKNDIKECFPDFIPASDSSKKTNLTDEKPSPEVKESSTRPGAFNRITGQAVADIGEFAGSTQGVVSLGFIAILTIGLILVRKKRRKKITKSHKN